MRVALRWASLATILALVVTDTAADYGCGKENFDFQSVDDVKVRWKNLPPLFDDKGNPRKPSDKERAELKGPDKKLPGYQADFADLRKDMTVEVQFPKANAKPDKGKKDKDK